MSDELLREIAVYVETTDRSEERLGLQINQVYHRPRGMRIADRTGDASRFVQRDVVMAVRQLDDTMIEDNLVDRKIDFDAKFLDNSAVDGHSPGLDQFVGAAP